jgi:hypothetical protein
MKKAHELRDMPLEELEGLEREKAEDLMNLKMFATCAARSRFSRR